MFPPNLITPGSLESQEEEMGTFRVQMIQRVLDIFFPRLPSATSPMARQNPSRGETLMITTRPGTSSLLCLAHASFLPAHAFNELQALHRAGG